MLIALQRPQGELVMTRGRRSDDNRIYGATQEFFIAVCNEAGQERLRLLGHVYLGNFA